MRKVRLLSTAAASLLIGTAAVSAQGMKQDEAPARAPAAQQNAPAEKIAPAMKPGENRAGDRKAPETTGQAPKASDADKIVRSAPDKGAKDKRRHGQDPATRAPPTKSPADANGSVNVKSKTDKNAAQDAAGSKANPVRNDRDEEHHHRPGRGRRLRQALDRAAQQDHHHHQAAEGAAGHAERLDPGRHPHSATACASIRCRREVVVIYPEWRGYDYILVGDEIVVIDPRTHEIVAILEA